MLIFVQFSNKAQKCLCFVIFMFFRSNFTELHGYEQITQSYTILSQFQEIV